MQNKKRKTNQITPDNNKDFVKDGMTTEEIRKIIQNIRLYIEKPGAATLNDRIIKLKEDYKLFVERYPILFDKSVEPEFNYEFLNYFLNKRDEIINDKISADDASKIVGKEWFDRFVDVTKLNKKE
jgi:hypothetical protein